MIPRSFLCKGVSLLPNFSFTHGKFATTCKIVTTPSIVVCDVLLESSSNVSDENYTNYLISGKDKVTCNLGCRHYIQYKNKGKLVFYSVINFINPYKKV